MFYQLTPPAGSALKVDHENRTQPGPVALGPGFQNDDPMPDWRPELKRRMHRLAKIQSYGITMNGRFILGLDGDTRDVFEDMLDFVRDSQLYEVQVTFMTAFPGEPHLNAGFGRRQILAGKWQNMCRCRLSKQTR